MMMRAKDLPMLLLSCLSLLLAADALAAPATPSLRFFNSGS